MSKALKFPIWKVEPLYYLCSENKGADQLSGYLAADICVFVYTKGGFYHDAAHLKIYKIFQLSSTRYSIGRSA